MQAYGSKETLNTKTSKPSALAQKLIKKYSPRGAHVGGIMGAASEPGAILEAKRRQQAWLRSKSKVDNTTVKKFIREVSLNDKFKGTWVAEGMNDKITQPCLAKVMQMKDYTEELVEADFRADEWLDEQEQIANFALTFKETPVDLAKYFGDYCRRNANGYRDYKQIGIKHLASSEQKRYADKLIVQEKARRMKIQPDKMLQF